jgi:intracellular sulfur oxidation DsrE/DsrF family protein
MNKTMGNLGVVMNNRKHTFKVLFFSSMVLGSAAVMADDTSHGGDDNNFIATYSDKCDTLPLVSTLMGGPENNSVCVDAPVALKKARAVFVLDSPIVSGDKPVGLRHMFMLGTALKARIQAGELDPKDVSIVGVFYGSASAWALKSSPDYAKKFIEKIFDLSNQGVNISLEICGATLLGKGWTNDDLYVSNRGKEYGFIHVNQGAMLRIIDLQQQGFAYIQENDANPIK